MLIRSIYTIRDSFHLRRKKRVEKRREKTSSRTSVSRSKAGFRKLRAGIFPSTLFKSIGGPREKFYHCSSHSRRTLSARSGAWQSFRIAKIDAREMSFVCQRFESTTARRFLPARRFREISTQRIGCKISK